MKVNLQHKVRHIMFFVLTMIAFQVQSQVSVTATAGTTGPTSYTTVNAALAAITAGTHQGRITITISGNTTEPTFAAANQLVASGTGLANYQSVRIVPSGNVVVNSAATPTANRGMLEFIGADSVTIDGDDPLTPGTRNLTFQMAISTNTYTSALRFSSSAATANTGCRDVTVKNCIIIGARNSATSTTINFGITASVGGSGTMTAITGQAADNDNMVIENNEFKRAYYGFHAYGHATNVMDSLVIRNNKFGNDTSAINMGLFGIYLGYTALTAGTGSAVIEGNEIQGGDYGVTGWAANIAGLNLNIGNAGAIVRNNNIRDLAQPSTGGYGAYGIFISSATNNNNIRIFNNFIRGVRVFTYQNSTTSTWQPIGIFVNAAVTGLRISHNTIVMPNQLVANPTYSSHGVLLTSTASLAEFVNNIIVNQYPSSAGYAVTFNGVANYSSAFMDKNNYFTVGSNLGFAGAARANLNEWRTNTSKDSNSFVSNPPFISVTNLRLQAGVKSILESNGAVTSITTDIDGNVRPGPTGSVNGGALAPDIGAHESDMIVDSKGIDSVTVTQITGFVSPGNTNQGILRIAAHVSGSIGDLRMASLYLNTAGSTSTADISNAKVYFTGISPLFSISTPYGSVTTSPSGAFIMSDTTVLQTGINYFWLAYDISGSATPTNVVDGRLDSVQFTYNATPGFRLPVNGNPAGNILIAAPMTYVSSTATHPTLSKIETGTNNNQILRVRVIMSSTGAPVSVSQLNLDVAGSASPLTNIDSISVWYTGANPNFVSPTFFGSASTQSGPYVVTGVQNLLNDTNYFWVTYRVPVTATIGDSVDAEIASITVAGTPQIPSVTAPAGARLIRAPYCQSVATSPAADGEIWNVTVGTMNNSSNCSTTGGPGSTLGGYSDYSMLVSPPNLIAGSSVPFSVHTTTCGGNYSGVLGIWIDLNDDGDFTDPGEELHMSPVFTYGPTMFRTGNLSIPCASLGLKRMRVVMIETGTSPISPCGTYGFGETEDYTVNIVSAPATFVATNALQTSAQVGAGTTNVPVMRVPVKVVSTACSPGVITQMNFNTAGTTNVNDIVSAKLYRIGASNVFSTANLVGTVLSPSGAFSFNFVDSTINDTNNYWLAYDVSATAANSNLLDARLDSVEAIGGWRLPINGNPAGAITVTVPMTFLGSDAVHPTLAQIERGSNNNPMLRVRVITSSTGAPIAATQFDLTTNGSSPAFATNVDSIIVWYTGNNPNLVSPQFFGGTGAQTAPFSITGNRNLANDTNYFWVTYNVIGTANVGDSLDAEITGITIAGVNQFPVGGAPNGARYIRAPYCIPTISSGCGIDYISQVTTLNAITNINNLTLCNGNPNAYINNANLTVTAAKGQTFTINLMAGGDIEGLGVWIDYNNNGLFEPSEFVFSAPPSINVLQTGQITVPCNALSGVTRMRVRAMYNYTPLATDPCTNITWGETEDYNFNIVEVAPSFQFTTALQQTGTTSAGANNIPILRVPVRVASTICDPAVATEFRFNTIGTTNATDILAAKLYKTNGTTFNTNNLIGTVLSPSGQFSFLVSDTMNNDTNNYWLAYDVSTSASNANVLDARFDSVEVIGAWRTPVVGAPTGNVLITVPITYLSSTASHPTLAKIERGSTNNQMLRMMVVMSSTGAPVQATQFALSTNGSVNTASNIDSIMVWYTGANPNFATTTFFGGTGTQNGPFTVNGLVNLLPDTNYFWLTYRVPANAIIDDSLDAEVSGITIAGVNQIPLVSAPAGARYIRAPYCASGATSAFDSDIGQVTITSGSTTILNNGIGCTPSNANTLANGTYTNFTNLTPAVLPTGTIANLSICYVSSGAEYASQAAIYIDFNDNGLWDAGEMVWNSTIATIPNVNNILLGSFVVPTNVAPGIKRMRVVLIETGTPLTLANACNTFSWGETEDYLVNIVPGSGNTYSWNQTAPGTFNTAANWTPSRTMHNIDDRLVFANGGNRTVNEVLENPIKAIVVDNNTNVTLNAASAVRLGASDTLYLNSGRINTNNNVTVMVGSAAGATGFISGTEGVNGQLGRWINNTIATYNFPIVTANGTNRNMVLDYTTAPTTRGTVISTFVSGIPGNNGLPLTDGLISVNRAGEDGVFRLTAANGLAGGTYTLTFQADSFKGVNIASALTVIRRVDNASAWTLSGTAVATTGTNVSPILSRSGLTVYGEFGVGGDTLTNPLPVTMLSFTASQVKGNVLLNWATANEINNKGFDIERSINGEAFEAINFTKGMGNTRNITNYAYTDNQAFAKTGVNTLYYRLRQFDFDGSYAYSNVVTVNLNDELSNDAVVYPNPFTTDLGVEINSIEAGKATIAIRDINGKLIATEQVQVTAGKYFHSLRNVDALAAGVYVVTVQNAGKVYNVKVTKTN